MKPILFNVWSDVQESDSMYSLFAKYAMTLPTPPIDEPHVNTEALVSLIAAIVDHETDGGSLTEGDECLENQIYWQVLRTVMKECGFTMLGNGHFSAAYSHAKLPGRIIKVGFKKEDSGAAYTAFCRMHQGRAGIPNIHNVQRHTACYTVVMDKLVGYDSEDVTHEDHKECAYELIDCGYDGGEWQPYVSDEYIETCKLIREFFIGIASFDMHRGNIMFGHDGTPYITDPVSFSQRADREKAFSLDPEELLKEIEQDAIDKMIARCKARKAKCDPKGTFWINKKLKRKNRKASKRAHKAAMEQAIRDQKRHKMLRDRRFHAQYLIGTGHFNNMWFNAESAQRDDLIDKVVDAVIAQNRIKEAMALAWNLPRPMDIILQNRLMG